MDDDKKTEIEKIKQQLTLNNIKIYSHDEIKTISILGEGSFGTVWKALIDQDKEVAIKLLDKINFGESDNAAQETITTIVNELKAMTKIEHPQIPKFFGVWEKNEEGDVKFGLIFSFIDGVTLKTHLTKNPNTSSSDKCLILIGLTQVILDIHKSGVIHRDIKPENVMITKDNKVVLLDFGISKISEKTETYTCGRRMTPRYSPPEAIIDLSNDDESNFAISKKFDVWSLGIVIVEMFSNTQPWSNKFKDDHKILLALSRNAEFTVDGKKYPFPYPKNFPTDFPEVMEITINCIKIDVTERYTSDILLEKLQILRQFYLDKGL